MRTTLFHTTQAWPIIVPAALGLLCAGLAMVDLYRRLRRWLGVAALVAAGELCVALVVSRTTFFTTALPAGGLVAGMYALLLARGHMAAPPKSDGQRDGRRGSAFARLRRVEGFHSEWNTSDADDFFDAADSSGITSRHDVHRHGNPTAEDEIQSRREQREGGGEDP